jgi:hypothetical protein
MPAPNLPRLPPLLTQIARTVQALRADRSLRKEVIHTARHHIVHITYITDKIVTRGDTGSGLLDGVCL